MLYVYVYHDIYIHIYIYISIYVSLYIYIKNKRLGVLEGLRQKLRHHARLPVLHRLPQRALGLRVWASGLAVQG
jgi:hypothetical protein